MSSQLDISKNIPMDETTVVTFAPTADIILEVRSPDGKTHLLVTSSCLALASQIFNKMLSSQFKEGVGNHSPPEHHFLIPLPEDNADALVLFCNVIHHRMHDVPRNPSLTCLKSLAVLCDKYDCAGVFAAWGELWLGTHIESATAENLNDLLFVAYVLDLPEAFKRISWEILKEQSGPFVSLPGLTDHELVHHNLLGMPRRLSKARRMVLKLTDFKRNSGRKRQRSS
jgi:hypothetical protein